MRSRSTADPESTRQFAIEMARTLADSKCTDLVLLDVRGRSQVCDYVIIGSGTSQRQMRSAAQEVEGGCGQLRARATITLRRA